MEVRETINTDTVIVTLSRELMSPPPLPRLPLEVSNPVTMWCDGCRLAHVALGFCLFQKGLSVCKHPLTQPHVFSLVVSIFVTHTQTGSFWAQMGRRVRAWGGRGVIRQTFVSLANSFQFLTLIVLSFLLDIYPVPISRTFARLSFMSHQLTRATRCRSIVKHPTHIHFVKKCLFFVSRNRIRQSLIESIVCFIFFYLF